jgi:transcriptional regulator with XRE-family HTH domain
MMRLTPLKRCRFERGVLQAVLARRAAIAWGRLSAIENGVTQAEPDELDRLATALQVPIERLLEPAFAPRRAPLLSA